MVGFGRNFTVYNTIICKKAYRRTEPCGTPDVTYVMSDRAPLTETLSVCGWIEKICSNFECFQ